MGKPPLVAAAVVAALLCSQPALAQSSASVPVGHWAYPALERLAALGLFPMHLLRAQPLSRGEVARIILRIHASPAREDLGPRDRALLSDLEAEFAREVSALRVGARAGAIGLGLRLGGVAGAAETPTMHPDSRPGQQGLVEFRAGTGALALDVAGGQYVPAVPRAAVSAAFGSVSLELGRNSMRWGPGSRGALLLSEDAGPLDMARVVVEIPHIRYTKFAARLEEVGGYLFGTRLDWTVSDRLRVGLSETAVAFPSQILWYHVVNPFPGVTTTLLRFWDIQSRVGGNDNILGAFDFDLVLRPGVLIYGEVMIDDVHLPFPPMVPPGGPFPAVDPSRWGFMAGAFLTDPFGNRRTDVRAEYTRVYNWTYTHHLPTRTYRLRGRSLGHWLGSDGDDLAVVVTHGLPSGGMLQGWLAYTRHGEGRLGTIWGSTDEAWARYFLSGVVETRITAGGGWERRWDGSRLGISAEISRVENRNNVAGDSGLDLSVRISYARHW